MGIELICLKESSHLIKRAVKYWHLVGKIYLESLRDPYSAKIIRTSYFFCRHIDDVLDGDRKITDDPLTYVNDVLYAIKNKHQ